MSPHTRRLRLSALTAAAITALALLALPGAVRADGEALDRKVDVALADSAPDQAFAGLARMIGLESAVEPGLDGKVTVRLQNVRMRTVLDAVCESIGCTWSVVPGTPARLRILPLAERSARKAVVLDAPIDLKVTKADVREVLQTFGQIMSAAVELDPQISGKVSLELDNIPVGKALDAVCAEARCDWKLDGDGGRSVLRITARK